MQFPGWTNAWTMPIKTRVDMLTTGVRTPVGIKVFGTDLDEIEKVGVELEHVLAPIKGTRSVFYERNLGGLYLDIVPRPRRLARYGLRVADVERVIESAIGGTPIGDDRRGPEPVLDQRALPAGPAQRPRALRRVLSRSAAAPRAAAEAASPMGTQGRAGTPRRAGVACADGVGCRPTSSRRHGRGGRRAAGCGAPDARSRLPSGAAPIPTIRDAPMGVAGPPMEAPPDAVGAMPRAVAGSRAAAPAAGQAFVPLGQVADIRIAGGPPMVRDEAGLLVGYVYVDIDQAQRDVGGYVDEAKAVVASARATATLTLPPATPEVDGPVRAARARWTSG